MNNTQELVSRKRRPFTFLMAFLITLGMTILLIALRGWLELPTISLLYLLPVGVSAAMWGLGPGIFSALIAFFSLNYFFIPPYGTLMVHKSQDLLMLIVFLGLAISVSQLVGRITESLAVARTREYETNRLYELSLTFSKLHREADIQYQLTRHILETFHAEQVEIFMEGGVQPNIIRMPGKSPAKTILPVSPDKLVSLQGSQRLLGEIRVWRSGQPFNSDEIRLLQTYSRQGVLALERARLAASESRTRILEESDRMKSALLSSVSHELRTPLATITGALSSLSDEGLSLDEDSRRSLIDTASEEAERLNHLVGNLLDMTRLEAGGMRIKCEPCDIQDIIGSALEALSPRLKDRVVAADIPEDLPLVKMDFVLIERVIVNVVDNALKYSPPDLPVEILVRANQSHLRIEIADRGIGIPVEDLESVFQKFHPVKRATGKSGIGLGLSICKGIVQAHGGAVAAKNRDGGGTIIIITLPRV